MGLLPPEFKELAKTLANRLHLQRPIAFVDLETTGTNVQTSRIVEIAIVRLFPDGKTTLTSRRLNPGIPIPPEATAVHGIRDDDVDNEPDFQRLAPYIATELDDCDLAGFGIARFDVQVLEAEFTRARHPFSLQGRVIVDALSIFFEREPRDLSAALRFYQNKELREAHNAQGDALASLEVLAGQYDRYPDLPTDLALLGELAIPVTPDPNWVDRKGLLVWRNDEIYLNFGMHKGTRVSDLMKVSPEYFDWIVGQDFPEDVKATLLNIQNGFHPQRPV